MSLKRRGEVDIKWNGEVKTLKFKMRTIAKFEEMTGRSVSSIITKGMRQGVKQTDIAKLLFCFLDDYKDINNLYDDFDDNIDHLDEYEKAVVVGYISYNKGTEKAKQFGRVIDKMNEQQEKLSEKSEQAMEDMIEKMEEDEKN